MAQGSRRGPGRGSGNRFGLRRDVHGRTRGRACVRSYTGRGALWATMPLMTIPKETVRKAVFPAAGLGTRFLPATKAQPKEMLPLVDKPIIQYGVEEALASGINNMILVTGRGKNAIEDHFDVSVELETFLESRGKTELLAEIRKISNLINFSYVRQGEPLGLGHAVLVTRMLVGRRALRGDPRRRRDRRGSAGAEADDRRVPRGRGTGAGDRRGPARERQLATASSTARKSVPASTGSATWSRSRRSSRRPRISRSSAATSSRPTSSRRWRKPPRSGIAPERSS